MVEYRLFYQFIDTIISMLSWFPFFWGGRTRNTNNFFQGFFTKNTTIMIKHALRIWVNNNDDLKHFLIKHTLRKWYSNLGDITFPIKYPPVNCIYYLKIWPNCPQTWGGRYCISSRYSFSKLYLTLTKFRPNCAESAEGGKNIYSWTSFTKLYSTLKFGSILFSW